MIIKSLTRKNTSFKQIVKYVLTDKGNITDPYASFTVLQNLLHQPTEIAAIAESFERNDVFRKKRKNGVSLYHDILSFDQKDSPVLTDEKLEAIARKYIELRGGDKSLALAKPHYSEKHWHIHIVFHGSELLSSKNLRMDKKQFAGVKAKIQQFQLEEFPEIVHSFNQHRTHSKYLRKIPETNREYQQKLRIEKEQAAGQFIEKPLNKKELLKTELVAILENANDIETVLAHYAATGRTVYYRNKELTGIIEDNKKYRFLTLLRGRDDLAIKYLELVIQAAAQALKEQQSKRLVRGGSAKVETIKSKPKKKQYFNPNIDAATLAKHQKKLDKLRKQKEEQQEQEKDLGIEKD